MTWTKAQIRELGVEVCPECNCITNVVQAARRYLLSMEVPPAKR